MKYLAFDGHCLFDIFKCTHLVGLHDISQMLNHWTSIFKSSSDIRRSLSVWIVVYSSISSAHSLPLDLTIDGISFT